MVNSISACLRERHSSHLDPPTGRDGAVYAGAALFLFYLLIPLGPYVAGTYGDDGFYLALGRALAEGEGYHSIYYPGSPAQVKYPPGLPWVYSLFWRWTGSLSGVLGAVHVLNASAIGGAAGLLWRIGRKRMGISALPVAVLVLGPLLLVEALRLNRAALSEPVFVFLWAVALTLSIRLRRAGESASGTEAVLLGAVLGAAVLVRSQAIVLIPAVLLAQYISRLDTRQTAITGLIASAPALAWSAYQRWTGTEGIPALPDEGAYSSWIPTESLGELARFLLTQPVLGVFGYGWWLSLTIAPVGVGLVIVVLVAALIVQGSRRAIRSYPELWLTTVFSVLLVVIWPWVFIRLFLPVLPFLGLLAADQLDRMSAPGGRSRMLVTGIVLSAATVIAFTQVSRFGTGPGGVAELGRFISSAGPWIGENTDSIDVLLAPSPGGVFLRTGRKTVNAGPAEPSHARSVFAEPGRFYAALIVADSIDVLILPAPTEWARHAGSLHERCPEDVRRLPTPAAFVAYRVTRHACLNTLR